MTFAMRGRLYMRCDLFHVSINVQRLAHLRSSDPSFSGTYVGPELALKEVRSRSKNVCSGANVSNLLHRIWKDDEGQDIAEYAVMLAVIVVIVVGTVSLIGRNA